VKVRLLEGWMRRKESDRGIGEAVSSWIHTVVSESSVTSGLTGFLVGFLLFLLFLR
jgi:hypothetical protein